MNLFPRWERLLFSLLPGYCPLCLGQQPGNTPWCHACFQALPINANACYVCAEPLVVLGSKASKELPERDDESPLCCGCMENPLLIHHMLAPLLYKGEVARLLCRYKQRGDLLAGRLVFELWWQLIMEHQQNRDELQEIDAILPVPPDRLRTRERGFDPVLWLASRLARLLDRPLIKAVRVQQAHCQKVLDRQARFSNMKGAFHVPSALPARVMLFDDVMTSGATLNSLAASCFENGVEWVGALALSRTPLN